MRIAQVGELLAAEGIVSQQTRQVHFVEHHRAHLANAFFASPFEEAAVISIDGFGDFSSLMRGMRKGNHHGDQCRLNLDYFTHHSKGVEMTWYEGESVLG